jgi:Ankyrin repeats (3 copies)
MVLKSCLAPFLPVIADAGLFGEEAAVPTDCLPDNPDLGKLKDHAKVLRDLVRAGIEGSISLVREHHPRFGDLTAGSTTATGFKLADAQLTVARHYEFASWAKLRHYVETVNRLSRSPHEQPVGARTEDDASRADELLRLACLNYGNDNPARWANAERLLAEHPHLVAHSILTAAAVGALDAVQVHLDRDPEAAGREGGPFAWPPLLYLTYSRLGPGAGRDPVGVATLLLAAGANPNAGYLWDGLPSPFTALTGVFGRGEQGAPPHRHELVLARLLLAAGAEANDSQTIYNRGAGDIARDDTDFLELLLDHGLGHGDGGPWRRLLAHGHQTPTEIAAEALQHAAEAGLERRVRLLLSRGVDPNIGGTHPCYHGRSPYEGAILQGNTVIADLLVNAGALPTTADPFSPFIGACLAADRRAVSEAVAAEPDLLASVLAEHSDLVVRAAELGRGDAIRLLIDLGFDVNARRRTTALHEAAQHGNLPIAMLLVELGADPTIVDTEHNSTPAGWAEHTGHSDVAEYLRQISRPEPM